MKLIVIDGDNLQHTHKLKNPDLPIVTVARGGITAFDVSGRYVDTNRSEIFLRLGFRVILELPADLTIDEATKLKQYIDLMAV